MRHKYGYIYIYICACVFSWSVVFHLSVFDWIIDTFCLYNFIKILSSFLTSVLECYVGIGRWIYQNYLECFQTFHRPSSGVVWMCEKNLTKTLSTQANNPWWWPMKCSKMLGTFLVNSSTNPNLKTRHLSGNLKGF